MDIMNILNDDEINNIDDIICDHCGDVIYQHKYFNNLFGRKDSVVNNKNDHKCIVTFACNICQNLQHQIYELYCHCGQLKSLFQDICNICEKHHHNYSEFDFICYLCNEEHSMFDKENICSMYINKIIKIQRWFRNVKKNKILWKIAKYYTEKKYSPDNILMYMDFD